MNGGEETEKKNRNEQFQAQVGKNIKRLRFSLRLTQEELAEKAKVSTETVVKLENGRQWFSLESLLNICDALCTTPCQLFLNPERDRLIPIEDLVGFTKGYGKTENVQYKIKNARRKPDS